MWVSYNPNPVGGRTEDCSIRALAAALDVSWDDAFEMLAGIAKKMGVMPSNKAAVGAALRMNGFSRSAIPNSCPDCYTVGDFAEDHPRGVYVLGSDSHVATVIDGDLYDTWDSRDCIPIYVWSE